MRLPFDGSYPKTQDFNDPRYRGNYAQFGLMGHNGWDLGLPAWTPVLAPHAGRVIEATSDPTGYGNYVKIENGVEGSILAHLARYSVSPGQLVGEGELIGYSGNTGNSTGPHLHWGYYRFPRKRDNGFNGFIDQEHWLSLKLPTLEITPQTKIPQLGNEEVGAIASQLSDLRRDYKGALAQAADLGRQLSEVRSELGRVQAELKACKEAPAPPQPTPQPAPPPTPTLWTFITEALKRWLERKDGTGSR